MASSSEFLTDLRSSNGVLRMVRFDLVIAVDFYDGPETGVAFFSSGQGMKFKVLAESDSKMFRAFSFMLLGGNWKDMVKSAMDTSDKLPGSRIVFHTQTDNIISTLESAVSGAVEQSYYVGVGESYLDKLAISTISKSQLDKISGDLQRKNIYRDIHLYIKSREKKNGGKIFDK